MGVWCLGVVTWSKKDILWFLYLIYIAIRMVVQFRRRWCIYNLKIRTVAAVVYATCFYKSTANKVVLTVNTYFII
jgi:hypothetical protein